MFYEIEEVARMTKLSEATLRKWLRSKEGGRDFWRYTTRIGKRNVITKDNFLLWLSETAGDVAKAGGSK